MRMKVITPLLEQIREARVEGMKEERRKCERITGQVASFDYGICGLLTLHGGFGFCTGAEYDRF